MNSTHCLGKSLYTLGFFGGIETHDMLIVGDDGVIQTLTGDVVFSLNPPPTKRPPGRLKKKRIESQFQVKWIIYCSRCNMPGHNRKTYKNPLS